MANDASVVSITLEAGSDLSASTNLNRFVLIASDGQVDLVGSAGGEATGVLYNDPDAAGKAAQVAVGGVVRVMAGGTVTVGEKIQSNGIGDAITAASGDHVLGTCLKTAASGELTEVLLQSHHILA